MCFTFLVDGIVQLLIYNLDNQSNIKYTHVLPVLLPHTTPCTLSLQEEHLVWVLVVTGAQVKYILCGCFTALRHLTLIIAVRMLTVYIFTNWLSSPLCSYLHPSSGMQPPPCRSTFLTKTRKCCHTCMLGILGSTIPLLVVGDYSVLPEAVHVHMYILYVLYTSAL